MLEISSWLFYVVFLFLFTFVGFLILTKYIIDDYEIKYVYP